jgi:O-antigen/teichoic acid export membrane protein
MGSKRIFINAGTTYCKHLISLLGLFLLIPFIVRQIGVEEFGLWSLTYSIVGFLGLIEFGLGVTTIRYVAGCKSAEELRNSGSLLGTLFFLHVAAALLAFVGVVVIAIHYESFFTVPAQRLGAALSLLWLLALQSIILKLPLEIFRNILYGRNRIALINAVQLASFSIYVLLAVAWLLEEHSSVVSIGWAWCKSIYVAVSFPVDGFGLEHLTGG